MSIELRERAIKTANRYLEIQRLEVCHGDVSLDTPRQPSERARPNGESGSSQVAGCVEGNVPLAHMHRG